MNHKGKLDYADESILDKILQKKELKDIKRSVAEKIFRKFVEEHPKLDLEAKKNREFAVKEVRRRLRGIYGAFKIIRNKEKLLSQIENLNDTEHHDKILRLHKSTRERLREYGEVYRKIFDVTGKPKTILDLGCGLNPFSLPYMGIKLRYYAFDISDAEAKFIQEYFDKFGIKGWAVSVDLFEAEKFPKADVCFMFKLLDTLESQKRDVSKELIEKIDAKYLVVSFPTVSLGGRKKISTRRLVWFRRIIEKYPYITFSISNEIFFIIHKKSYSRNK